MEQCKPAIFFETPEDKQRAFQTPNLIMLFGEMVVSRWENTQPLYFYPFSWLDYLNASGIKELYVVDSSTETIDSAIKLLRSPGKLHFEYPDIIGIEKALDLGHKVSVICDIEALTPSHVSVLASTDFVRVRAGKDSDLSSLTNLPNDRLLSCVKVYAGEGVDYMTLASQARDIGFDFFHVAKRLALDINLELSARERGDISRLNELESGQFRIVVPSSFDRRYAERFRISPAFGNTRSCLFAEYRRVLHGNKFYPCYTQLVLGQEAVSKVAMDELASNRDCSDCACIYENDMLFNIRDKMKKFKNLRFALEYKGNGR